MVDLHTAMKFRRLSNYLLGQFGDNIDEVAVFGGSMLVRMKHGCAGTVIALEDLEKSADAITGMIARSMEEAVKCRH